MAFVPEDGTGLSNSNSYVSEAFADAYFTDRGNASWAAASSGDKQTALVRGTDYVDKLFGPKFRGFKQSQAQALEWPRIGALDNDDYLLNSPSDAIPRSLQKATCEYAVRALGTTLAPDNSNVGVNITRNKVGPIETEQELQTSGGTGVVSPSSLPDYPEAALWMQELLKTKVNRQIRRG